VTTMLESTIAKHAATKSALLAHLADSSCGSASSSKSSAHSSALTPLSCELPEAAGGGASSSLSSSNAAGSANGWLSGSILPAAPPFLFGAPSTPSSADTDMPRRPHLFVAADSSFLGAAFSSSKSKSTFFRPVRRPTSQPRPRSSESTTPPPRSLTRCPVDPSEVDQKCCLNRSPDPARWICVRGLLRTAHDPIQNIQKSVGAQGYEVEGIDDGRYGSLAEKQELRNDAHGF
jgi:hypothetical protein